VNVFIVPCRSLYFLGLLGKLLISHILSFKTMGISCSCARQADHSCAVINSSIVSKQSVPLDTSSSSTVNRDLKTYLEENQAYMNEKLVQLFSAAIEKPAEALVSIQLKLCSMSERDWVHFATLVQYGKAAVQFMVRKTNVSRLGFCLLCSNLEVFTGLKTLVLEDVGLGYHQMSLFVDGLKRLEGLKSLNLAANRLTSDHMVQLIPAFYHHRSLTELNLDENQLKDSGCALLCSNIDSLPLLTRLSLRYNAIQALGVSCLLAIVETRWIQVCAEGNMIQQIDLEHLQLAETCPSC